LSQERDERVGLDALLVVVEDRANRRIALERAERFFNLTKLQAIVPRLHRIGLGQVGRDD
jgi:hypothetical protein